MTPSLRTALSTAVVAALLGAAGCDDDNRSTPDPDVAPAVLVRQDTADAATCAHGGTVVRSGSDRSGDGILQDAEVAVSTPLCLPSPTPAPPMVISRQAPYTGTECADGGTAVSSGPDRNRNGSLDDDEVVATTYVCDDRVVTRMEPVTAGDQCAGDGIAFQVGHDLDQDGVLDGDEVEHTEYECSDVLSRDVVVTSDADLALLAGIRVITGDLRIDNAAISELSLPRLELIGGSLRIEDSEALHRVSLPALTALDGGLTVYRMAALAELSLPALTRIDGSLSLARNPALDGLAQLSALAELGGDLYLASNDLLASLPPVLRRVEGDVSIVSNPTLLDVDLLVMDGVDIRGNTALRQVKLSASTVWTIDDIGEIQISANPALASVDVYAGVTGRIDVVDNQALSSVQITADRVAGPLTIDGVRELAVSVRARYIAESITIDGALIVRGPASSLSNDLSRVIIGGLTLHDTALTALPSGLDVRGNVQLSNNAVLTEARFTAVGGGLVATDNPVLTEVRILEPGVFHGDVLFARNALLRWLPGLQHTTEIQGSLSFFDNPSMVRTAMHGLRSVSGGVTFYNLPALIGFDLHGVTTIGGVLTISGTGVGAWEDMTGLGRLAHVGDISISGNPSLTALRLPALENTGWFHVNDNPSLRGLVLPVLSRAESMSIDNNAALPICAISELFARVASDRESQSGNDDDGVCR